MIPKLQDYLTYWNILSENDIKPGLKAIELALQKVGNPEKRLKVIHVAGTNGKGSTIAFMESILQAHGYSTGVFSSPAIIDVHDQIRINGHPVTKEELHHTFRQIKEAGLSGQLTEFELLTVAAFLTLERHSLDIVLIETGMGGLLDSTNVVIPIVSVITTIALDHTAFLGNTIEQIAVQKAGIIKSGIPVVCGNIDHRAQTVIQTVAEEKGCTAFVYEHHFTIDKLNIGEQFIGQNTYFIPNRRMKGLHQAINAAVAIEALEIAGFDLIQSKLAIGVQTANLPYRFQEIKPGIYVDGAHNPAAAAALRKTIETEFPGEKVHFVIGMLKGKDIQGTLDELQPIAASFTFTTFSHPQAASAMELIENCNHKEKKMTCAYDDTILLVSTDEKKKIVTGSLYLLASLFN